MKTAFTFLIFIASVSHTCSQNIISATPAILQIYLLKSDGRQVVLSTDHLNNQFDQLNMAGELNLDQLMTEDPRLNELLDSSRIRKITYSTKIPEGQFVFQNTVNYTFSSEVEIRAGDVVSRFILDYEISNMKTNIANNFLVTCTGFLSLKEHFGIEDPGEIQDKVSFQFFQTVRSMTY